MANDPLRLEFAGKDPDDVPEDETANEMLDELVERFECWDYLPFAYRIIWLGSVKEALGYIPDYFHLTYSEIRGLVLLHEETTKKLAYDNWQLREESARARTQALSASRIPHTPRLRHR